jgi:hypothetical protein
MVMQDQDQQSIVNMLIVNSEELYLVVLEIGE